MHSRKDRITALIMLLPSLVLLAIFVYGFIGQTVNFSLTDWGGTGAPPPLQENVEKDYIGTQNYKDLMTGFLEFPFRNSLINTFFFTVFFLVGCLLLGFVLAFLIDQKIMGEGVFRTIFLFPMSLSFVVTGTIWRWLLQPKGGINVLPEKITNVTLFDKHIFPEFLRVKVLDSGWMNSREQSWTFMWSEVPKYLTYLGLILFGIWAFNALMAKRWRTLGYIGVGAFGFGLLYVIGFWDKVFLPLQVPAAELQKGYNAALTGIIVAAIWQMSGYVMALFLAGIRGIPEDLREAARVDGCSEWKVYLYIILPGLRPIILSAVIILGHISLKIFDLVFAMAGPDNNQTIVPGILLYTKAFRGNQLASGSAVAVVMLVLVSLVIVPYLWSNLRTESQS